MVWQLKRTGSYQRRCDGPCLPSGSIDYEEVVYEQSNCEDIDVERCRWLLREFLEPSSDDEYESYYVPVMAACAGVGTVLFDDWVDCTCGHHGHKEENIRPFKWKGPSMPVTLNCIRWRRS